MIRMRARPDFPAGGLPCPGQTFLIEYTVANLGNLNAGYDIKFFFSADNNVTLTDTSLGAFSGGFQPAGTWSTLQRLVNIPAATPRGSTWFFGWIVDFDNNVSERSETNNVGFNPNSINVCP